MTRLEEIKARVQKATEGPWRYGSTLSNGGCAIGSNECATNIAVTCTELNALNDAAFIAAAREDVPWLVFEVERLRGLVKQAETQGRIIDEDTDHGCPWCGSAVQYSTEMHDECPAFHPSGEVR